MSTDTRPFLPPDRAERLAIQARTFAHVVRRMLAGGGGMSAISAAEATATREVVTALKGAIPGIGLSDEMRAYQLTAEAFLASLATFSAFDRLLPAMRQLVPNTRTAITTGITGVLVNEGAAIPVSALSFDPGLIDPIKVAALLVTTQEFARLSESAAALNRELQAAVGRATDAVFVNALVDAVTPTPSSGDSVSDIDTMLANVEAGADAQLFFIFDPLTVRVLANERGSGGDLRWPSLGAMGGTIAGVPVVPSDGLMAGDGLLVDASQVAGWGGEIALDASTQTDIQLDSAPTMQSMGGSPSAPTGTQVTSMFMTNGVALKALRYLGFSVPRPAAIAAVSGISYTAGSP